MVVPIRLNCTEFGNIWKNRSLQLKNVWNIIELPRKLPYDLHEGMAFLPRDDVRPHWHIVSVNRIPYDPAELCLEPNTAGEFQCDVDRFFVGRDDLKARHEVHFKHVHTDKFALKSQVTIRLDFNGRVVKMLFDESLNLAV